MTQTIYAADLFCGAGGFTTGLLRAAERAGLAVDLLAVNHWPIAVETHSKNHPGVVHYCESIEGVDPRKAVPGGHLHLLMASPECVHHSNARGGKPMNDQSRSTAWHVLRWAEALSIDHILIENVKEFRSWGPLHPKGHPKEFRPIESRKGELFRRFLSMLRALDYTVDVRILNAADYGDATTRHRLFIQAKRGRKKPIWPEPSHVKSDDLGLYPDSSPWRAAREIIDWSLPGTSIYSRKKPLAPNTMRRIMAGLRKYSGLPFIVGAGGPTGQGEPASVDKPLGTVLTEDHRCLAQPFLVVLRNNCDALPVSGPLPTICADGSHVGVAEPFLVNMKGQSNACDIEAPAPTITAHAAHLYLCEPFVIGQQSCAAPRATGEPLPTVATAGAISLVEPFIVATGHAGGNGSYTYSTARPLPTLTTQTENALVEPFLMPITHSGGENRVGRSHSLDAPLPTLTTQPELAVVEPFLVVNRTHSDASGVHEPLHTLTTGGNMGLAQPYVVSLRGGEDDYTRGAQIDSPLPTLTTINPHGLAQPFIVPLTHAGGENRAHDLAAPLPTVTTAHRGEFALAEPYLVEYHGEKAGEEPRTRDVDKPLSTVDTSNRLGLVQPFLVNYHGNGAALSVDDPLDTVDCRDRYALVSPELAAQVVGKGEIVGVLDIRFRMLQPHELAAAHSFPADYYFAGTRDDRVKQVGNSVGVGQAEALCLEILRPYAQA